MKPRKKPRKTRAYRSVRTFGARGDGVTDDTAVIAVAHASPRDAFLAEVATMAGEIYDHAQAHIEAEASRVRQQALAAVRDILASKMAPLSLPAPTPPPPPRQAQPRAVESVAEVFDPPRQKNGKAAPSCRICGKVGKNANSCGKTADHPGPGGTVSPPAVSAPAQPKATKTKPSTISGSARAALERTRAARAMDDDDDDTDDGDLSDARMKSLRDTDPLFDPDEHESAAAEE